MNKQDKFSRQEYSMDSLKRDSVVSHKPPTARKPESRPRLSSSRRERGSVGEKSVDSCQMGSTVSKGSKLSELCDEDKMKIGNLIQRLAEETELKKRAEEEMMRVKNMYSQELENLKEQNVKLAENSKMIEEKYKEVSELVKQTMKPQNPTKEVGTEVENIVVKAKPAKKKKSILAQPQEPIIEHQPNIEVQDKSVSSKTIPKKPPTNSSISKVKQQPQKSAATITNHFQQRTGLNEVQAVSSTHRDRLDSPKQSDDRKRSRFLLPQRGDSLEKFERIEDNSEDEIEIVSGKVSLQEYEKHQKKKMIEKATKRELRKKEEAKRCTLEDILKLKSEVKEVTKAFKDIDLEKKEADTLKCKEQFQKELNRRLDEYQSIANRNSFEKALDEEEYMKSLRAAYEESSSDEEELAKRILEKKRDKFPTGGQGNSFQQHYVPHRSKNNHLNQDYYRQEHLKYEDSDEEGYRARVSLPKQAKKDPSPQFPIQQKRQKQHYTKNLPSKKPATNWGYCLETSEEDEPKREAPKNYINTKIQFKRLDIDHIEDMNHDQLAVVKQMIEERINENQWARNHKTSSKRRSEEPEIRLDDNFYDEKFLSLVYEMESQRDDSFVNY